MIHSEVVLKPLDYHWREHLNLINHLSKMINFRSYGQKDPLIEFKKEAFDSFSHFISQKRQDTLSRIFRVAVNMSDETAEDIILQHSDTTQLQTPNDTFVPLPDKLINPDTGQEISFFDFPRNALCPCESNKKFKHCHGTADEFARRMAS
jgi:preprotein translocase subunit SecA